MGLLRYGIVFALVAVATATAVAGLAQAPPRTPDHLVGVWELNVSKSRYRPGPAPTSETRTYVRVGSDVQGIIQRTFQGGRRERVEYTANFDREYPVMGTEEYDHVVLKRIDEYTSEAVLSHAGRVYGVARRVISTDERSMTITFRRDSESGVSVYNVAVYNRIGGGNTGAR